jgi:predicted peptidase
MARTLIALFALTMTANIAAAADNLDRFTKHEFAAKDGPKLLYRRLAPQKIVEGEKYPLVIFLHGAGERGDDNEKQLVHGMRDFASDENMAKYPAFVIAPQCPEERKWAEIDWTLESSTLPEKISEPLGATLALVDEMLAKEPIDNNRIYITGLSMGGYGTWDALARRPDFFAAAAPICGGGDPSTVARFKHVPIWAFHGDQDTAVKPNRSREMIEALQSAGGEPKYTEYKGVAHDSWTQTYADPALHAWLFAQKKR